MKRRWKVVAGPSQESQKYPPPAISDGEHLIGILGRDGLWFDSAGKNAERIRRCVNALDGIDNPEALAELLASVGEFLGLCDEALLDGEWTDEDGNSTDTPVVDQLRRAYARMHGRHVTIRVQGMFEGGVWFLTHGDRWVVEEGSARNFRSVVEARSIAQRFGAQVIRDGVIV